MNLEYGETKGFKFAILSLLSLIVFHIFFNTLMLTMLFGTVIPIFLENLFDTITLVFAILAFLCAKDELGIDSENKKAVLGKYVGLSIIAFELIYVFI